MKMEYTVIRSDRRTIGLTVTAQGEVIVRAPKRAAKRDIVRVVEEHRDWIEKHVGKARQRMAQLPQGNADREECIVRAREMLPVLVARYAQQLGVNPTGIRITDAEKRFGSCSAKNSLCFAWRLMRWPQEAVEYVVVHELAHIREKNHSPAFYAVIAQVMPDYKARWALLKEPPPRR